MWTVTGALEVGVAPLKIRLTRDQLHCDAPPVLVPGATRHKYLRSFHGAHRVQISV